MASFDVENLFTNIPLPQTINICLNPLFENCDAVIGLSPLEEVIEFRSQIKSQILSNLTLDCFEH